MCADEIHRLRMAVDLHEQGAELMRDEAARLKGELAALKEAVRPVVTACYAAYADGELDERIDGEMLFKLAAQVGL